MTACDLCGGACCETFILSPSIVPQFSEDWLDARGALLPNGSCELEARCPMLDREGRCSIYHSRPDACAIFAVGGPGCVSAIKRRRSFWASRLRSLFPVSSSGTARPAPAPRDEEPPPRSGEPGPPASEGA